MTKNLSNVVEDMERYQRELEVSHHDKPKLPPARMHREHGLLWSLLA